MVNEIFKGVAITLIAALITWITLRLIRKKPRPVSNTDPIVDTYVEDRDTIRAIYVAVTEQSGAAITGLRGMGGIGKTEAAKHVAQILRDEGRFTDGIYFIDLRGFSETGSPMEAREALGTLISTVTGQFAPPDASVDQLRSTWTARCSGKDRLIILDNARDAEQIEPLVPPLDGPKVLVTSRETISLPKDYGEIEIGRLDRDKTERLIANLIPSLKRNQVERIWALSRGLPLLVENLCGAINGDDARTADEVLALYDSAADETGIAEIDHIKALLRATLEALPVEDIGRYAALSLFPESFSAQSACALWGMNAQEGKQMLARFDRRNLLLEVRLEEKAKDQRFRLHDYLGEVAHEWFGIIDEPEQTSYRHRWGPEALKLLSTANQMFRTKDMDMAGLRLFEMEQVTIRAAQAWVVQKAEADDTAADLSMRFPNFDILDLRLTPRERIGWLEAGLPAAQRLGDRTTEALLLGNAGYLYKSLGEFETAEARLTASLDILTEQGDRLRMAQSHGNLGVLFRNMGELEKAEEAFEASLEISEALSREAAERGDETAQREADLATAKTHGNLGSVYLLQEKYAEAEQSYRASLEIKERLGMRQGMANTFGNLGEFYRRQGRLDEAAVAFDQGLEINTEMNNREGMAANNFNLALLRLQQGQVAQARDHARTARALYAEVGLDHHVAETDALLAEIDQAGG